MTQTVMPALVAISAALVLIGQRVTLWALPQLDTAGLPARLVRRVAWWQRSARAVSLASVALVVAALVTMVVAHRF